MSKKFIVALNGSPQLRDPITEHLLAQDYHVWHWFADLWLLAEVPEESTERTLYRDMVRAVPLLKFTSAIVLEVGGEMGYTGRTPKAEAWDWIREFWRNTDTPGDDEVAYMPNTKPKSQEKSA